MSIEHIGPNGVKFVCEDAGLNSPVKVTLPAGTWLSHLMEDVTDFISWHALCIFPDLPSFRGYSGIKYLYFQEGTSETEGAVLLTSSSVDTLAQAIRAVDGRNNLGAGVLAEKILEVLAVTRSCH